MRSLLRAVVCGALLAMAAGCNIAGLFGYAAGGSMKVPAEYKLENRPTVVLVENYENADLYALPADRLERGITDDLTEGKLAKLIAPDKVNDVKSSDPTDYHKMDIPALGRAVGAKQVVYVNLVQFTVDSPAGGDRFVGKAEVHVKVVDSDTGHTLWPPDSSNGRVLKYETKTTDEVDATKFDRVEDQLCQNLTQKISRLFREITVEEQENEQAAMSR
ncbi:MAG TPA: hypothetical protein VK797_20485 [Tepidisphaeraceae bacterium]|nr:hypothetical protein [Tepidisphaeraceae bacterium]